VKGVPAPAVAIGLAGLLPFLYGALLVLVPPGTLPTFGVVASDPTGGATMLERFGAAILGFMGGCLWGFASARPGGPSLAALLAASVPALIAFLALQDDVRMSCLWLAVGFAVLQAIDVGMHRAALVPDYWLALRLPLTAIVLACLLVGALYA
jgi:hypothetical protein